MAGYHTILLHAHLPFVRHPEWDNFLEEDWYYEAVTETYLPLLQMFERLTNDGVDWRLTMSLTPPLLNMMAGAGQAMSGPCLSPEGSVSRY